MSDENLLTLTADIVAAHLGHNDVLPGDLPGLIETVYAALGALGKPEPVVPSKLEPAVAIRSSVKADAITCLECGMRLKMLKRHLQTYHHFSPAEYKARWGLPSDYPLVAADYAARRSDLARQIGLGRKPGSRPKSAASAISAPSPQGPSASEIKPAPKVKAGRKSRTTTPAPVEG